MVAPFLAHALSNMSTAEVAVPTVRLQVADHDAAADSAQAEPVRLSAPMDDVLTLELDGAAFALGLASDELLLAALGRTVARTIADGVLTVDIARDGGAAQQAVDVICAAENDVSATEMVTAVHRTLGAAGGAPSFFGDAAPASNEIFFNYLGTQPSRQSAEHPASGHALELRAYRDGGSMQLDWWYDSGRFDHATVLELSEQFPFALIELTSEATPVG
jgi:hypothetical protein